MRMDRSPFRISRWMFTVGVTLTAVLTLAGPALAQGGGDGFLFRPPAGAFAVRGGFDLAGAGSDVFRFVTDELTVNRRDFSSATLVFDVGFKVSPRVAGVFSVGIARSTTPSEFRHWVDNNNLPIQQTTEFQRVPVTIALKTYLSDTGRSIGRFAWIPKRFAYVGGGGESCGHRFQQQGTSSTSTR